MAGWKPIGSIYDTIRKRWFGPGDIFAKGDWLPRLYAREFEHTDDAPNVDEQSSIPTPPPSGGADPRVDQLLRDVAELKAGPPGGGQDPRVESLLDRVSTVEGKVTRNGEGLVSARQVASEAKAVADGLASGVEQASAKAQAATEAATAATAKATQVGDEANQAKLKAEDAVAKAAQAATQASEASNTAQAASLNAMSASQSLQGLQTKVSAVEATAGRAEQKAGQAESKSISAQNAARQAAWVASEAKKVTDKVAPLNLDTTYTQVRMDATLAKQEADNAKIIAQGVGGKVQALEVWKQGIPEGQGLQEAVRKIGLLGSEQQISALVSSLVNGMGWTMKQKKKIGHGQELLPGDIKGVFVLLNPDPRNVAELEGQRTFYGAGPVLRVPAGNNPVVLIGSGNGTVQVLGSHDGKMSSFNAPLTLKTQGPELLLMSLSQKYVEDE